MEALRATLPMSRPFAARGGSRGACRSARPVAAAHAPSSAVVCSAASHEHGASVERQLGASRRDLLAAGVALLALAPPLARADDDAVVQELATADALPAAAEAEAVVAAEASAPLASAAPASAGAAEFTPLHDDTLAYSFEYPVTTGEGRQLSWVFTREPTRYSAAAPLSADARQRIVCEVRPDAPALLQQSLTPSPQLANFKGPLTLTVVVGPPPPVLESVGPPETWKPRQIVGALLADRSTGRVSSGQRVSLAALEALRVERHGDDDYIYYETASRGGPTFVDPKAATYRRGAGVVARRGGYYYSLSGSCPERLWPEVAPLFVRALESFRLDAPGTEFREPGEGLQFFSL